MNFWAVTNFFSRVVEICAQQRPHPWRCLDGTGRSYATVRGHELVGFGLLIAYENFQDYSSDFREFINCIPFFLSLSIMFTVFLEFAAFQGKASASPQKSRVSVRGWRSGSITNTCVTGAERWSVRLGYIRWWSAGRYAYDEKEDDGPQVA